MSDPLTATYFLLRRLFMASNHPSLENQVNHGIFEQVVRDVREEGWILPTTRQADLWPLFEKIIAEMLEEDWIKPESKYWKPNLTSRFRQAVAYQRRLQDREPLSEALRKQGFGVDLYRLTDEELRNPSLIAILLAHLDGHYMDTTLNDIVRAISLTMDFVDGQRQRSITQELLRRFESRPGECSFKSTIGFILECQATNDDLDRLLELLMDESHGGSRYGIVPAIGRLMGSEAVPLLIPLLNDKDIYNSVISTLGVLKVSEAIPYLEPFLKHDESYTRQAAKKAIRRCTQIKGKPRLPQPTSIDSLGETQVYEFSIGIDLEELESLLRKMNSTFNFKLPSKELTELAEDMNVDDERGFNFGVQIESASTIIQVRIFKDDLDACSLYVFSPSKPLVEALNELC